MERKLRYKGKKVPNNGLPGGDAFPGIGRKTRGCAAKGLKPARGVRALAEV